MRRTTHAKQVAGTIREYLRCCTPRKEYDADASRGRNTRRDGHKAQITKADKAARKQLDKPITDQELQDVMEALPTGKQAGPDRIPNEVYSCTNICHRFLPPS